MNNTFKGIVAGLIFFVVFCVLFIMVSGLPVGNTQTRSSNYKIVVSGDPGMKFTGCLTRILNDGTAEQQTVDGTVPAEYVMYGFMISVVAQKQDEGGALSVQINQGGQVVAQSSTTAAYGVVSVATQ